MNIIDYLKYSGASVSITLNPWHWSPIPKYFKNQEWGEENTHTVSWLFVTLRVWIDNGEW
jgi:hypothetical protein